MANVEMGQTSDIGGVELPKIKVDDWPRLREENRLDFERNLKPLFDRLDRFRSLSAQGRSWTPLPEQAPSI